MPSMLPRLAVLACGSAMITQAAASDAPLQRALAQASCAGGRLERLSDQGSTSLYRANCSRSSHRWLIVTCMKDACRVAPERDQTEE